MNLVLLEGSLFRHPREIDAEIPNVFGGFAVWLPGGATLPDPFRALRSVRQTRSTHAGKARSLERRVLGNELRRRSHGTFFRSIGAAALDPDNKSQPISVE